MHKKRNSGNAQQPLPLPKGELHRLKCLHKIRYLRDHDLKGKPQEKRQYHEWIIQMVHSEYGLIPVTHSYGVEELGYPSTVKA